MAVVEAAEVEVVALEVVAKTEMIMVMVSQKNLMDMKTVSGAASEEDSVDVVAEVAGVVEEEAAVAAISEVVTTMKKMASEAVEVADSATEMRTMRATTR